MPITVERVSDAQAITVIRIEEGQFAEVKSVEIAPAQLSKTVSAFTNSDGGDLFVGVCETGTNKVRSWKGFEDQEAANGHLQLFEKLFPLGTGFNYEFLECDSQPGLVLHVQVNKTSAIVRASNDVLYIRRGAQNLPITTPDALIRLQYGKGISSFESELTNTPVEMVIESEVTVNFIQQVVPSAEPAPWLRKQALVRNDKPTVAGVLMFADEPQAQLPKRCGIKVYRYKTTESEGFRGALAFDPETVEGPLYNQIKEAVAITTTHVEAIPRMGSESLVSITYPPRDAPRNHNQCCSAPRLQYC